MISADAMRSGLAQGEFFLEYLPIVSLADGRCIGAGALIRRRRSSGVVPPMEFISVAENTVLSGLITYWVVETMAVELGDWLRANSGAQVNINVPPEVLGRGGMLYAAERAGLADLFPQIVLEVTERGLPDLLGVETLNRVKDFGLRVALDDVALVGGASVAVLARADLDVIKIDKSLVSELEPDRPYPDWPNEIAALVSSSRVVVIAEGVETERQLLALREAGIQAAQGFHFSRPLPAAGLMAYHREAHGSGSNRTSQ